MKTLSALVLALSTAVVPAHAQQAAGGLVAVDVDAVGIQLIDQRAGARRSEAVQTELSRLGPDLAALIGGADPKSQTVLIRTHENVPYSQFMRVANKLSDNAFYRLTAPAQPFSMLLARPGEAFPRAFLNVETTGLFLGSLPTSRETLLEDVAAALAVSDPRGQPIGIRANRDLPSGEFLRAMAMLRQIGFTDVKVISEDL